MFRGSKYERGELGIEERFDEPVAADCTDHLLVAGACSIEKAGTCGEEKWRCGRAVGVEGTEGSGVVPRTPREVRLLLFRRGWMRFVPVANFAW